MQSDTCSLHRRSPSFSNPRCFAGVLERKRHDFALPVCMVDVTAMAFREAFVIKDPCGGTISRSAIPGKRLLAGPTAVDCDWRPVATIARRAGAAMVRRPHRAAGAIHPPTGLAVRKLRQLCLSDQAQHAERGDASSAAGVAGAQDPERAGVSAL